MSRAKRILVAPLDWGLGHATRCIPIIRDLIAQEAEVLIVADGRSHVFLKMEFPKLTVLEMPGYGITYPKGGSMTGRLIIQLPKILLGIYREHQILKGIIEHYHVDGIISDNRYGLWSKVKPSVFMTHQVMVKMPGALKPLEALIYRMNRFFMSKYLETWIPDNENGLQLSGDLSHKFPLPRNAHYIGPLSRFKKQGSIQKKYDLMAILSGPEPQRSIFEAIVMQELAKLDARSLVVQGMPEKQDGESTSGNITVISSLGSEDMNEAIESADIIISRPGYSTIMDLAVLGKKAILVPTPGQTEQEYLARINNGKGIYFTVPQEHFDLKVALEEVQKLNGIQRDEINPELLSSTISRFLSKVPDPD